MPPKPPRYSPAWKSLLTPDERSDCFYRALDRLCTADRLEVDSVIIAVSDGRFQHLGAVGAVELVAALGIYLNQHSLQKQENLA